MNIKSNQTWFGDLTSDGNQTGDENEETCIHDGEKNELLSNAGGSVENVQSLRNIGSEDGGIHGEF